MSDYIYTRIESRYNAFDASGRLPFSILFGLCRRHAGAETDRRPLLIDIAGSALDVPYALTHGLLTLYEQNLESAETWVPVDSSQMGEVAPQQSEYISVSSPVNREGPWEDAFTVHHYHFDPESALASLLKPGKTYRFNLMSKDLGIKKWGYSDQGYLGATGEDSNDDSTTPRLHGSNPWPGHARFKVVKSLPWPPAVKTTMHLCAASPPSSYASAGAANDSTNLEVSVVNTGSETITVQTRGHHNMLFPRDISGPELGPMDETERIIDTSVRVSAGCNLQVVDAVTGKVVRKHEKNLSACSLRDMTRDRRPSVETLVVLKPGIPVIRIVDFGKLLHGLDDGHYKIRLQPKGCRWWQGKVKDEPGENGRVPARLCKIITIPVMLESQDEVEIHVKDGKLK